MEPLALAGLAAVLFLKEAGLPIPVPGDLLVIGAGVAAAGDPFTAGTILVVILLAGFVGGAVQFLLARGALRRRLIDLLVRVGVPRARLDALADLLRRRGARGVAVARTTPGVRVGAIAAAGLAALPLSTFIGGLIVGNSLFVGAHFLLGYVIGPPAVGALAGSSTAMLVAGLVALLGVAGALGWRAIRGRASGSAARPVPGEPPAATSDASPFGYGAWADAACPACLALALVPPSARLDSDAAIGS